MHVFQATTNPAPTAIFSGAAWTTRCGVRTCCGGTAEPADLTAIDEPSLRAHVLAAVHPPADDVPATKPPPFITNAVLLRARKILLLVFEAGTLVNPTPTPTPTPNSNPNPNPNPNQGGLCLLAQL